MSDKIDHETAQEMQAMISTAEAAHRGSYSFHVLEWRAWRIRCKIPMIHKADRLWDPDAIVT